MATVRDVVTRFKFDLDRAKLQQLNSSLDEVLKDVRGLSNEEVRLARSLKVAAVALESNQRGFRKAGQDAKKFGNDLDKIPPKLDRLSLAQKRFDATSRRVALAGDVQSNLGAIRGLAGAAGAAGLGEGIGVAGEIAVLAEELPRLKESLAGLPSTIGVAVEALGGFRQLGVATAILGAAALAFKAVSDESARAGEVIRQATEVQRAYYDAIVTGTTESIEAQIKQLEAQREIARLTFNNQALPELQRQLENTNGVVERVAFGIESFAGFFTGVAPAVNVAGQEAQKLADEYNKTGQQIDVLKLALQSSSVAANDAVIAEEELATKRTDFAQQFRREQDQLIIAEDQARRQALDLTREAVQERIATAQQEIADNNALIQSRKLSAEAIDGLIGRNNALAANIRGLTAGGGQLDFKKLFGGLDKLAEDARKRADAFKVAQDKISAQSVQFNQALNNIATGLRENVAKLSRERSNALSEAEREAGTARADAVRENGQALAELERNTARERERIIRSANAGIANAIQDRDAVALLAAQSARDEQLRQQEENYSDQRQQIDQQLVETNRQIVARLAEQRQAINQRYNEQVADAQRAAQQQRQTEIQKNQQILADLRQAAAQAIQIERNKNASLTQSAINAAQQISGVFSSIAQRVAMAAASRPRTSSSFGRAGGQIGPAPRPSSTPSLASGFTTAGLVQSRGVNVNIANAGVTPKMVGETVVKAYDNFLRGFTS